MTHNTPAPNSSVSLQQQSIIGLNREDISQFRNMPEEHHAELLMDINSPFYSPEMDMLGDESEPGVVCSLVWIR